MPLTLPMPSPRAHKLNIIHRDLKLANVLIGEDGVLRLTDFGLAFDMTKQRLTQKEGLVGTAQYLSPETIYGEAIDNRTDIWAFGIMLFEMLTGKTPFADVSLMIIVKNILENPLPDLEALRPDIPIALIDLVYRMLEKDRKLRIASVRYVGAELEDILHGRDRRSTDLRRFEDINQQTKLMRRITTHNLPAEMTPFVGREHELETLIKLVQDSTTRLVTILGMGGIGKTRLVLQLARNIVNQHESRPQQFRHGVYFIPLAPIASADHVATTIAENVQFTFYSADNPEKQLIDYLREKSMLLVIDNFEHVIAAAQLVSNILQNAPHIKVIVTSRERLNIRSETMYTLDGMDFPEWETPEDVYHYSSVKLFMQSARRAKPDFELTIDNLPMLARICRLVQGMPLGLELAAAWVDYLSLNDIAEQIQSNFDFLETEMRDVPDRHRSIRAVFDYSWALLDDKERDLVMKLSIFRGGFTLAAAVAVTGAMLRTLMTLVNKSWLFRDANGRFHIHELIRQHAEELLRDSNLEAAIADAHAKYFADFLHGIIPHFGISDDIFRTHSQTFEVELYNMRSAWQVATENSDTATLMKLLIPLNGLAHFYGHYQTTYDVLEQTIQAYRKIEHDSAAGSLFLTLLTSIGWLSFRLGRIESAIQILQEVIVLMDTALLPIGFQDPYTGLAMAYSILGNYDKALKLGRHGLEFNTSRNDQFNIMQSNYVLTSASIGNGDYEKAKAYSLEALRIAKNFRQSWFQAYANIDLGHIARATNDFSAARDHYLTSYNLRKDITHDAEGMAVSLRWLGQIELAEGHPKAAQDRFNESIALYSEIGDRFGLVMALTGLGEALTALGDYDAAYPQFHRALRLLAEVQIAPLTLSTLVSYSHLLLVSGDSEKGHEVLGIVLNHPMTKPESQTEAQAILDTYGDNNHTALAQREHVDLDDVVSKLLQ